MFIKVQHDITVSYLDLAKYKSLQVSLRINRLVRLKKPNQDFRISYSVFHKTKEATTGCINPSLLKPKNLRRNPQRVDPNFEDFDKKTNGAN